MMKHLLTAIFALTLSTAWALDEYTIDAAHTQVGFSVKHMVISTVRGNFKEFSGTVFYDDKDISKSTITGAIKVGSVNTDNEKRDEHLRSADFFNAEKYPDITFTSKKVFKGDQGLVAVGDLTMHGVTKEIRLEFSVTEKITDPWGNERIGVEAKGKINRQDFGVSWSKSMDNGGLVVSDEVKLELFGEFVKKK